MQNDDFEQGLVCPSFNSYSSDNLAAVAAMVCREFDDLKLLDESNNSGDRQLDGDKKHDDEDDDDFEFVSFQKSADQVFLDDSRIGPVFPVFNRDLLLDDKSQRDLNLAAAARNNKVEEGDDDALPSSSSSEVDELEAVPPGTYCVWMPKSAAQEARGKCKKSKSTGTSSSRRWSIRDLLRRSNSEGGKNLVLLTPLSSSSKKVEDDQKEKVVQEQGKDKKSNGSGSGSGEPKPKPNKATMNGGNKGGANAVSMAHETFYVRNKTVAKDGYNKRRSYLPYRPDLVGFFASASAMSRTFPAL